MPYGDGLQNYTLHLGVGAIHKGMHTSPKNFSMITVKGLLPYIPGLTEEATCFTRFSIALIFWEIFVLSVAHGQVVQMWI